MFEQPKTKFQIGALFGCISDSLQPLAVYSHQLLFVQPNDSGKRNTAKSCTEYSQYICSVAKRLKPYKLFFDARSNNHVSLLALKSLHIKSECYGDSCSLISCLIIQTNFL